MTLLYQLLPSTFLSNRLLCTFFFVHCGFDKPFLLQNMSEQPHIAIHVFSLTPLISIDAVGDRLISKTLIQIKGQVEEVEEGSMGDILGLQRRRRNLKKTSSFCLLPCYGWRPQELVFVTLPLLSLRVVSIQD